MPNTMQMYTFIDKDSSWRLEECEWIALKNCRYGLNVKIFKDDDVSSWCILQEDYLRYFILLVHKTPESQVPKKTKRSYAQRDQAACFGA